MQLSRRRLGNERHRGRHVAGEHPLHGAHQQQQQRRRGKRHQPGGDGDREIGADRHRLLANPITSAPQIGPAIAAENGAAP